METKEEILKLLHQHLVKFPSEAAILQPFIEFVNDQEGEQLFNRKNFKGHITASAFIIDASGTHLLLLKHKVLNRWLQPGGHVDATDASLLLAALREAKEETGINAADLAISCNGVFDFDSHLIPENILRQELSHYHHDVRFLFKYTKTGNIKIAANESTGSKWFSLSELENSADFSEVIKKIYALAF